MFHWKKETIMKVYSPEKNLENDTPPGNEEEDEFDVLTPDAYKEKREKYQSDVKKRFLKEIRARLACGVESRMFDVPDSMNGITLGEVRDYLIDKGWVVDIFRGAYDGKLTLRLRLPGETL